MKEIGSEFWSVPLSKDENHLFDSAVWFLSGRTALRCIIKDIKKSRRLDSVALPAWCCDSMIVPFLDAGVRVGFYPVYLSERTLKADYSGTDGYDALLILDYFGYHRQDYPIDFQGILIHDMTHLPFIDPCKRADYAFGSLRKWNGFHTGGFAKKCCGEWVCGSISAPDSEYVRLRKTAALEKQAYISGKSDQKEFLTLFRQAEERLDALTDIYAACDRDITAAKYLDIACVKTRRRENARVLLKYLGRYALFDTIEKNDCPMFVPIVVPDGRRDEMRDHLIQNAVYCPVHWPLPPCSRMDKRSLFLYENTLSIICDQRYDASDMARIGQLIIEFLGEPYAESTDTEAK